jgi:prepilin-type processing-associated H-X9-DG protein
MDNAMSQIAGYLWSQSGQIALLVMAVAILGHLLRHRSAHARYLLWLLVVAKCLVPPLFGVAVPILPHDGQATASVPLEQSTGAGTEMTATDFLEGAAAQNPPPSLQETPKAHGLLPALSVQEAIVLMWLTGLIVFLAVASIKAGRMMRRLVRERTELPSEIHRDVRRLFGGLGMERMPKVWMVEGASQPFVWGLWRGDIYLPADFISLGDPEHRQDILAHEASHVLRHDAAVNLLQILAQAAFWFHPFVWWANIKIRQEREKCCDEMAIVRLGAPPRRYSRAIVEALLVEHTSNGLMPSLAIAGPAKNIEERIKTMLRPGKRFYRRPSLPASTCALVLALLIVPTTLALTSRPADKTDAHDTANAQEAAAKPTAEQIEQQRATSMEKLKKFALRLVMFAVEHEGRYPAHNEISWASEEDPNTFDTYLLEKVEYLGEGKTERGIGTNANNVPLAFDIPLLQVAGGTNVVFADAHVEFVPTAQLAARGVTIPKVSLEAVDVQFEPIDQGKNIVHVTVKNTSDQEQLFAAHIYTRSPNYGVPNPDPDKGGVGWGTSGYFNPLRPGETKALRLVFKIQGPVTDRTYVNLRFSNPATQESYDGKWYFYNRKYLSAELPKAKANEAVRARASSAEARAVTQAFTQIQSYIQNRQYEQAWERFSKDYQMAEYQRYGFEWFRRAMEPTHPMHSAFTWERGDFLKLTPGQVVKRDGVLALTATGGGQTWTIDFVREDNQWKIDWIAGYTPAIIRIQKEESPSRDGGSGNLTMPQEEPAASAEKSGNLKVLDVQFEPIHQGKNVVRIKVQNTFDADQTFGLDIRTEGPIRNWQRQLHEALKAGKTKTLTFNVEFLGPITDGSTVRLRFYNPASADAFDISKWFEERRYTSSELPVSEGARGPEGPVSEAEKDAVIKAFRGFQDAIKGHDYPAAWNLSSEHLRSMFNNDIGKFKESQMGDGQARDMFLSLRPESVTRLGTWLTLDTQAGYKAMKIHFVQEDGQWKIYAGQADTSNWEDRVLPEMEKRSTTHFDIYYFKDSTAAHEIDQISRQKDAGFEQICRFVGRDSDVRIRLVFFEDQETKRTATGHQGAGWAYGRTIVEVYNDREKLDPYHETTHILMGPLGNPPALFNEGFAVYMSERLGAYALESLSGGKAAIHQRVRELRDKGDWIELPKLLSFTEIGSEQTRPPVAYAEAASFVKFLIDTYGKDKFLQAYKTLRNSGNKAVQEDNVKKLEQICGKPLQTLQQQWEAALTRS